MKPIVLGIGDMAVTNEPGASIKTFALGSCVAIVLFDPRTRTIGMAHIALPESTVSPAKAQEKPGYFADTAIVALLAAMGKKGCNPTGKGLSVKLAGGAQVLDPNNIFNIGKRNVLAIKKYLWQRGLGVIAEDTGGSISRTVTADVEKHLLIIHSPGRETVEL